MTLFGCGGDESGLPVFATAAVRTAPLVDSVLATGKVETVISVQVSSQLSGRVNEVFVDFNDMVSKGQPLAALDQQRFTSRVEELRAALAVAEADLASVTASLAGAHAKFDEDARDAKRKKELVARGSISKTDADRAATQSLRSESELQSMQASRGNKKAAVAAAAATLRQAEIDLERTVIKAPIAGIVIKRSIEPGQTVAASLEAPELFVIAHDLADIEVHARVDEADIGKVRAGQRVQFRVDAHSGRWFDGRVSQIRKAPEMMQNVVTYAVIVSARNPDELMLPGMTALVEIISAEKDAALQVPNAALRFKMPAGYARGETVPSAAGQSSVWVEGDDGPVRRDIEVGYSDGQFTEVLSGSLEAGDVVIVGFLQ